jgi:hypothetical protein
MNSAEVLKPFVDSPRLAAIKDNLRQCTGTEEYHRAGLGLIFTDGVKWLADDAECHWLISDLSIVAQMKFSKIPFQLWKFRSKDSVGLLTMQEDTGSPVLYEQKYEYTDFPEGEIKLYVCDGIILLPSEY